ncbi:Enoyl-CoA hydratase/isomerase [Caldalkalibacillus thermarum TA2.A1]|uniref:Enoyl-CoA hydratase/isomerase n=1 Tax=Caldalkalibacillus thermarum (strain TA2.A1) TaxID=986075 RepID=F5L9G6_CALTT|nr:enoyl-CoA hydratase-related protein [Caldalkalibacillus thermarum]EGL81953.1 Enoyl-CoA hydratase/isomerase [Caldalkalibacillus thermarum TA2.A1]QZT34474.1 enoyl-CoA hydratase/isomerase family protein [Caldalkalibacillus thermarum TA2.A1]
MYTTIRFEIEDQVAIVTLNRPDKLNAFTEEMNKEITKAFKDIATNDEIRAVLLTGAGRAFSAGEDLASVKGDKPVNHGQFLRKRYNPMILAIRNLEKPVVAAVNGVAAGAGCSLALACDFRIASDQASFIEAFIHIGLIPDSGSCYFLPRLVGVAKAMELAVLGDKITAEKAYELGLVNRVVEAGKLDEEAFRFAKRLAEMPTRAIGLIKRTMDRALHSRTLEEALEYEAYAQEIAGKTRDHQEGVKAFFEKRKPRFEGK